MSAGELAGGVDLKIRIWRKLVDERDQEPPDPPGSVARVLVAAGIENQCSPDLASRLLNCKLEELLVEICDRLWQSQVDVTVTALSYVDVSGCQP